MALDVRDRLNELPRSQKYFVPYSREPQSLLTRHPLCRLYKATLVKQFADILKQYQSIQDESLRKEKIIVSSLEEEMGTHASSCGFLCRIYSRGGASHRPLCTLHSVGKGRKEGHGQGRWRSVRVLAGGNGTLCYLRAAIAPNNLHLAQGVEDINKRILTEQSSEIKSIEKDLTQINEVGFNLLWLRPSCVHLVCVCGRHVQMFKDMRQIVEEATPQLDAVEDKVSGAKAATEEGTVTLMQVRRLFTVCVSACVCTDGFGADNAGGDHGQMEEAADCRYHPCPHHCGGDHRRGHCRVQHLSGHPFIFRQSLMH